MSHISKQRSDMRLGSGRKPHGLSMRLAPAKETP